MKQVIPTILTAFLVLGVYSISFAQNTDNDNISTDARVVANITVTGQTALDFGDFSGSATTKTEDATGDLSSNDPGHFTVQASQNANVTLDYTQPTNLTNSDASSGDNTIALGSWTSSWDQDENLSSGTPGNTFNSGDAIDMPDGTIGVWIGATATYDGTEVPGNYTAQIQLTATYN